MTDDQDVIDREASAWLVRTEEGVLNPEEQRIFDAWRAADPRHAATLEAMRHTWGDIASLHHLAELVPLPDAAPPRSSFNSLKTFVVRRRASILVAVAAATSGLALMVVQMDTVEGTRHATEIAEIRNVTLPDGSTVTLGPRSSIRVRYSDAERRVELADGEAFFDVVHDARPFLVDAGSSIVRDLGTRFDVNRTDGSVRVSVLEGLVEVTRTDVGKVMPPRLLKAGQRTEVVFAKSSASPSAPAGDTAVAAAAALPTLTAQASGAWREGRLVYDNVRLADLVADVNRYYAPGVSLSSPEVGNLRITAAFRTSEIPAFMGVVGETLPVRAAKAADGMFTVTAAPR